MCQSRISDGVRVSLSGADNAGSLDDEVNSLREVQQVYIYTVQCMRRVRIMCNYITK